MMDRATTITPSAPASRASTTALESNENEAKMTPPKSTSQSSDIDCILVGAEAQVHTDNKKELSGDFKPLQTLMDVAISVEYGERLSCQVTIHEGLLRCHSKLFEQLCARAKLLRGRYIQSDAMMDRLALYMFPETTTEQFENDDMGAKVIPLILHIFEKHPLLEYQAETRKVIVDAVEDQITKKNTRVKRDSKEWSRNMSVRARIPLLKSHAVQTVAQSLYVRLHQVKKMEAQKAKDDSVKAIAQKRLILPGIEETAILSFVQWIYQRPMQCEEPDMLYAVLNLATKLGVEALAETCLSKLYNAAADSIQHARANAVPIHTLLGYGSGAADPVLEIVFINVFKDKSPPKRLLKLVIDTLAHCLDFELWAHLRELIGHEMALQLVEGMINSREVKIEHFDQTSFNSESDRLVDEKSAFMANNGCGFLR
ncbi:hypothetical protein N0V83_003397 [Neocucurbitaria cava]|uniref:BTB domain-containing protein n=1 Tax=Neocucurbitaria cava TaxID=798079 RepID=A0A9W8YC59_9PLEO|nr:hypothetical protein N0V83_003397 [Neocucurbitaria cava]